MSLTPIIPVADLEVRLGVPIGSLAGLDLARAEAAISDVSDEVRSYGLPWVDEDEVTITAPAEVVTIVRRVSLRIYRNPDELQSESFGGDYSYQNAPGSTSAYLSKAEIKIVRKSAGIGGRAFMIHTYIPPECDEETEEAA